MAKPWTEIEAHPRGGGLKRLVDTQVRPHLERLQKEDVDKDGHPKIVGLILFYGMGLFFFVFLLTFIILPGGVVGDVLRVVLFPFLTIGSFLAVAYLNRNVLLTWLLRAQLRDTARARALDPVARQLGLAYVPRPGGKHPVLNWLSKQSWLPPKLKTALDERPEPDSSMLPALEAARAAGIMGPEPIVLGTAEQKAQIEAQALSLLNVQDGFHGRSGEVEFDAFEWVESVEDSPDVFHLVLVLALARPIQGVVELRARGMGWLPAGKAGPFQTVQLGAEAFHDQYRLRTTDQVEAHALFDPAVVERLITLSHGEKFRAVARDEHLIVSLEGEDRFGLIDIQTGQWSDETLRQCLGDILELVDFVDAIGNTFRVGR